MATTAAPPSSSSPRSPTAPPPPPPPSTAGSGGGGGAVLNARLARLWELRSDSAAMSEALGAVAAALTAANAAHSGTAAATTTTPSSGDDSEAARRALRGAVETHAVAVAEQFLAALAPFRAQFHTVQASLADVTGAVAAAGRRIAESEASTATFVASAGELLAARDACDARLAEATAFLDDYELPPAEVAALTAGPQDADAGRAFYAALQRLAVVQERALALVPTARSALGVELLDAASKLQADALDRLFAWVHTACKDADRVAGLPAVADAAADEDGGGGGTSVGARRVAAARMLQAGTRALREARPAYFRACQEVAVGACKAQLVRRLLRALTGGGATGGGGGSGGGGSDGRPIDASAHDPLRYVGDICAWVHAAMVEQSDAFASLFYAGGAAPPPPPPPSADAPAATVGAAPLSVPDMLAALSDAIARPVTVRIDQVVGTQTSVVTAFRLADSLSFYEATVGALVTPDAPLVAALAASRAAAGGRLASNLKSTGERYRTSPHTFPTDLAASALVASAAALLRDLLRACSEALSSPPPADMDTLLAGLLPPLIDSCRASADGLRVTDTAVYMLNNLAALSSTLALYGGAPAGAWVARLRAEMASWEEGLVQAAANDLLTACGLMAKLTALRAAAGGSGGGGGLAGQPGLAAADWRPVLAAFYALLSSSAVLQLHDRIVAPDVRTRVRHDTMAVLSAAYARVYADLSAPAAGYTDASPPLLHHTPAAVDVLLGL